MLASAPRSKDCFELPPPEDEPPEEPDVTLGGPGLRRFLAGRRPAEVEASDPALLPEFARCFCVPLDA